MSLCIVVEELDVSTRNSSESRDLMGRIDAAGAYEGK